MNKLRGFSLIELMVVVAIVAILAVIAYPSYNEYVRKTRRVQAKTDLAEISQALERQFTLSRTYVGFPQTFNQSPRTGAKYYDITYTLAATTYTLTADPYGSQTQDTKCNKLTLNSLGVKTADGTLGTSECW